REVAGDDDERSELADRLGERERHSREDAGEDVGEDHTPERGQARGTERAGGLLGLRVELLQDGLHGPDHERQGDEHHREYDRRPGKRDADADRRATAVQGEERQTGDDRRQREREGDDRVDERLPAELVTYEPRR